MRISRWLRQGLIAALLTAIATSVFAQIIKPPPPRPKRKISPPTVRDVDHAFQGKSDQPLRNLFLKLRRAEDGADKPDVIAALVRGLQKRLDKASTTDADLHLMSLFAGYTSDEATEGLRSFLQIDDVRVIVIALRALTESDRLPPWNEVERLAERNDYDAVFALRRGVVSAAERDASIEAVDFLVETISTADGQLQYEAAQSLAKLTGQSFGGFGEKWAAWWKGARDSFRPIALNERMLASLKNDIPWKKTPSRFYRLPIYAQRVLFMIDRSGSMSTPDETGESRINRARRELETALAGLPEETRFSIVAFHSDVVSYSPRLVAATEAAKRDAILFARNLAPAKQTNCYDALSLSLAADPNLEAIYFLSDGAPTTGGIVEPPKIVEAVTLQNQLRTTALYTLGIDARGEHEAFLKQLAERNFGEYFSIR